MNDPVKNMKEQGGILHTANTGWANTKCRRVLTLTMDINFTLHPVGIFVACQSISAVYKFHIFKSQWHHLHKTWREDMSCC